MNQEQASRLLTLATYLRALPKEAVDMTSYARGKGPKGVIDVHSCGTTACALGWCSVVWPDVFGLEWDKIDYTQRATLSMYGKKSSFSADDVQNWFGLNYDECVWVFGGDIMRTSVEEADVLEQMARDKGWVVG